MANEIFTRIQLKYDSYTEWKKVEATFKPLKGEICIVNPATNLADADTNKVPCLMKVGDGANFFKDLPWISATAADVYKWAKAALVGYNSTTKTIEFKDAQGINVETIALTNLVSNSELATTLANYYTKAEIDELFGGVVNTVTTVAEGTGITVTDAGENGNHVYTVALDVDGAKTALGLGSAAYTDANAYATAAQGQKADTAVQPAALGSYYTKTEADAEFTTPAEVIAEVNKALADVSNEDSIANITTLVTYVNENASDLAAIITEVYGTAEMTGDSRIDTAVSNAANAVSTANNAATTAGNAATVAGEAKTLAQEAKEAATNATTGAAASANAAAESARQAALSAGAAFDSKVAAEAAQEAAKNAKEAAAFSEENARTSEQLADAAKGAAEAAQGKAEAAETNARGSEVAAAGSASAAAKSAEDADASADAALESKNAAAQSALTAEQQASTATQKANAAAGSATTATEKAAAAAQSATDANAAKEAAVAAKEAAEASNTSATAIANQAKSTADAAKSASDAATQAVAGLHTIATSGSIYDVAEGSNTTVTGAVKYLVFNCGTASTLID